MRTWTYVLLALGLGVYLFGLALGHPDTERTHRSPVGARMFSSAALVLAALAWWRMGQTTPLAGYTAFLALGMAFAFVGDLIMAGLISVQPTVIFGMLAFGITHVLYISGFAQGGHALGLSDPRAWGGGVAGGLAMAVIAWLALIRAPGSDPVLNYGALGYALLLGGMAGAAVGLAVQEPRFGILAAGGVLFLLSDAILGNQLFRHNTWFPVGDVVWSLYIAGQALIVFSSAALLQL